MNELKINVDKYTPYYYAGASLDFNPIHLDNDFAKSVGLPGTILHGLCTMAYVYRAACKDRERLKSIKVRFRGMVRPGDELTISGANEDIVVVNQHGDKVITNAKVTF